MDIGGVLYMRMVRSADLEFSSRGLVPVQRTTPIRPEEQVLLANDKQSEAKKDAVILNLKKDDRTDVTAETYTEHGQIDSSSPPKTLPAPEAPEDDSSLPAVLANKKFPTTDLLGKGSLLNMFA